MKIHTFTIYGTLPNYNEMIEKAKGDQRGIMYRKWKAIKDEAIAWRIKEQLPGVKLTEKCAMVIKWFSPDARIDQDNIEHAKKYICDAMQDAGLIPNDGWKQIGGGTLHEHHIDRKYPRIEVYLLENVVLTYQIKKTENAKV